MRGAAKHRVAPTCVACMLDLFLRAKTPARHRNYRFTTRTIVPVLERREEPVSWAVYVCIEHGLALGARHRDGVPFLEVHFLAGILDVIQWNEFAFFINARG